LRTGAAQSQDCVNPVRNLKIGTQFRDPENAQRNLKIAQIPRLSRTYINIGQCVSEVFASVQTVTIATPTWPLCTTGSFPFGTAKTLLKGATHYSHSTGHLNFCPFVVLNMNRKNGTVKPISMALDNRMLSQNGVIRTTD